MQKIQEGGEEVLPERTTEGKIRGVGSRRCPSSRRWAFVVTVSESADKLIRSPCTREPTGTRSVPPFTEQPSSSPLGRACGDHICYLFVVRPFPLTHSNPSSEIG
eukprot:GHVU01004752.1.p2 GENE.GHVU01004752.1~~GHVU01004752.1.p2  ORF type:complete len:105 (-),score=7.18 GHVU01004752.1:246-560(-)